MLAPMPVSQESKKFAKRLAVVGALALTKAFCEQLGRRLADALWPADEDDEEGDDDDDGES
jgi:hypothetical protein